MKKKTINVLWILIGASLFIFPVLGYPFVRKYLDETNYENRYFAEKPSLSLESYSSYSTAYEEYFNDHLPYRNQFVRGMNILKYQLFRENVGLVINGREGWLFYAGSNAINCYKRNSFFEEEYMQEIVENLTSLEEGVNKRGIKFRLLILPNKEEIYDEYMPAYYMKPDGPNRTDVLVDYICQNSDISVVYPKDEMRTEKDAWQLYFKYDTHYNCLGVLIAYEQLIESLGKEREYLSDFEVQKAGMKGRLSGKGDLENMMGFSGRFNYDYEYYVSEYPLLSDWERTEYSNSDSIYEESILLVGDSFRISLMPYFSKDFRSVKTIDFLACTEEILGEYQPDIVILELLERNDEVLSYYSLDN